jgi:hypothetical protein
MRHIPGITEADARVYFLTYRALLEDVENPMPNRDAPLSDFQVDVRCFALYIAIQLYSAQSKFATESRTNMAQDTWKKENSSTHSA